MKKLFYPASERNCAPILEVLSKLLLGPCLVLEVGSGSGQHAVAFSKALPHVQWQPSSYEADERESIEAHREEAGLPNLLPVRCLDLTTRDWPSEAVGAVLSINMVHIAPWEAAIGLFELAGKLLEADGLLITYGPYRFHGKYTAPSNERFSESLSSRNPAWGVRDVDDLSRLAETSGLVLRAAIPMPANNHILVWCRRDAAIPSGLQSISLAC
mmetsp:Transcript_4377/g.15380  ORF Transcript_4377/g.15380 Transcript_4377/m.15380 type:complete len:214 (+) Transcript_4377:3-644(+)